MRFKLVILVLLFNSSLVSQTSETQLDHLALKKDQLAQQIDRINKEIIDIKQKAIISDLKKIGLPSDNYIEHAAMILEYAETHEQAKWVAHMILPEIKNGTEGRSNDFRTDPKVKTGTTTQLDYFLTDTLANGTVNYDGYGYDRGHLAPSADFRRSQQALSESYFYSNMSPQLEDFNRLAWADLEGHLRSYVVTNDVPLYIITAPVLEDHLAKSSRSVNKVSIPEQFVKVAYDATNNIGIAFIMKNEKAKFPLDQYAVTIDEAEKVLGLNLFPSLPESIESSLSKNLWFEELEKGDVEPIYQPSMPRHHFNTLVGGQKMGQKVTVCGQVVATRHSNKGHLWMNLDKRYPNTIFSVFIRKEDLVHFDYKIKDYYLDKNICVTGKVTSFNKKDPQPLIQIKNSKGIKLYEISQNATQAGR